jgi:hypothetical protein
VPRECPALSLDIYFVRVSSAPSVWGDPYYTETAKITRPRLGMYENCVWKRSRTFAVIFIMQKEGTVIHASGTGKKHTPLNEKKGMESYPTLAVALTAAATSPTIPSPATALAILLAPTQGSSGDGFPPSTSTPLPLSGTPLVRSVRARSAIHVHALFPLAMYVDDPDKKEALPAQRQTFPRSP